MIRLGTLIKWTVFLAMMSSVYLILPELNRRRIISPFAGQIAFLIFMASYLFLERRFGDRRSRAETVETPEQIQNRIDILTQQLLAEPKESWKLYHERGTLMISTEDWQGAVDDFSKSLEQCREWETTARRYRGVALTELNRHEDAIDDLSFAIEHLIENFRPQYQQQDREDLGDCLLRRAECHIALNHHDSAKQDLRLMLPFLNEDGLALRSLHLANCHRDSGDIDSAIAEARNAIAIYKKCQASPETLETVYVFLGKHLNQAKQYDEAIAAFSHAIDLNRENEGSAEDLDALLAWRVNMSHYTGQLEAGRQDIKEMLERNPSDNFARYWRAMINSEAGDDKAAADEWLDLLNNSPDDERLLVNCAVVLAGAHDEKVRDGRKSLELANRLVELHKDPNWQSQGCLANAYSELGDFQNAIAAAERSLELAPDDEKPRRLRRLQDFRHGKPFRCESINQNN